MLYPEILEENHLLEDEYLTTDDSSLKKRIEHDQLWLSLKANILGNVPNSMVYSRELLKWMASYATKTNPAALVAGFITIVGTFSARKVFTDTGCSTSMYTAAIAETGSGKDAALKIPEKIFKIIQEQNTLVEETTIKSDGALNDILQDHSIVTILYDEFGDKLSALEKGGVHSKQLKEMFKSLYSKASIDGVYKPIRYSSSGGQKTNLRTFETIYKPCLSICGVTTETQLIKSLNKDMLGDGFLNRFIFINGSNMNSIKTINRNMNVPDNIREHFAELQIALHTELNNSSDDFIIMKKSKNANRLFNEIGDGSSFLDDIAVFCRNSSLTYPKEISMRWRENALRLATAITIYEGNINGEISEEILKWCYDLIKYTSIDFADLFEDKITKNDWILKQEELCKAFKKWFESDPQRSFKKGEITRNNRMFASLTPRVKDNLLEDLLEADYIENISKNKTPSYRYKVQSSTRN